MPQSYASSSYSPALLLLRITIILFVLLSSCKRESLQETSWDESICTDADCVGYQAIWADQLRNRNGLSQAWFDAHIHPKITAISPIYGGLSKFSIQYEIAIDWATWPGYDEFVVRIDSGIAPTPPVYVPNNVALSAADVAALIDAQFGSHISTVCPTDKLAFDSAREAIAYMQNRAIPHLASFSLRMPGRDEDRCPYLEARTTKPDDCSYATLDLATKDYKFLKLDCKVR